ncbi:hypothetical protein [Bradyrhizobium prioriisuperbiae]|uniref:hypothetical protein n=1 Tax=Bradyrhizobium prioriisuperbiae TaxID=2854389 RepID=UPI0028E529DC|nr:hypothetical protein [Bradyrhizobium prioritasuperba]
MSNQTTLRMLFAGLAACICIVPAASPASETAPAHLQLAQLFTSPAMAEYKRRLEEYKAARAEFEVDASAYWTAITEKRRTRNAKRRDRLEIAADDYVLAQPPVYTGPKRPVNPEPEPEPDKGTRPPKYIPVVSDFLKAAAQHFQFAPQRPAAEIEFKRAYVRTALAEGLTREQIVRVYAFETGGNGNYDLQSGFASGRPGSRAISTAIGYNQLLTTNSVELLAERGDHFIKVLTERAHALSGPPRKAMDHKLAVLKRMVAFCKTVPDEWNEHEKLAKTEQGLGVHAMVLDIDVGPLLQTHKLMTSVIFARNKGTTRPLTAAELEMMNLTGDGTGLDMVTMPASLREQVPTSNFFQRGGYERNPVAIRHNTVAKLFTVMNSRMDSAQNAQGAKDLAGL